MSYTKPVIINEFSGHGMSREGTKIEYIVIHNVGAVSTAKNNADYFKREGSEGVGAHYFVDNAAIYCSVDPKEKIYHCGPGKYYTQKHARCFNQNSIGIEMCKIDTHGTISKSAIEKTAMLVKYLMNKYDIDEDHVIRHYDVTGKACPSAYLENSKWKELKSILVTDTSVVSEKKIKLKVVAKDGLNLRLTANAEARLLGNIPYNKTVTVISFNTKRTWSKVKYNGVLGWICLAYAEKV